MSTETAIEAQPARPRAVLSVFDAVMITMGIVIGAGIFRTPSLVAAITSSEPLMIAAWIAGAVLSLIGALTYAELAAAFPSAGGDYTFLTRSYGRHVSFLFAWARVTVITTGSIALLGFVLGDYLSRLLPLGALSSAVYAAIAVIVLTAINLSGLKESVRLQNAFTIVEIGGVLLVAIAGLLIEPTGPIVAAQQVSSSSLTAFGAAMVFVLLTYGGWNEAAYVSAEIRGGQRSIMRALIIAIVLLGILYTLFILCVLKGLGMQGLQKSDALGIEIMQAAFGSAGSQLISTIVAISSLTSMNATMLVGARSNYALAHDWPALSFMNRWHGERHTPVVGFCVQALLALALIAFGAIAQDGFSTMVEFTAPVFWFFFMLSGIALFVLRHKEPHTSRPFKVPLYPVLPAIFVLTCAWLLYSSITYAQSQHAAFVGLLVMASGGIMWALLHATTRSKAVSS